LCPCTSTVQPCVPGPQHGFWSFPGVGKIGCFAFLPGSKHLLFCAWHPSGVHCSAAVDLYASSCWKELTRHSTLYILLQVRHLCSKSFHGCLVSTTTPPPLCMSGHCPLWSRSAVCQQFRLWCRHWSNNRRCEVLRLVVIIKEPVLCKGGKFISSPTMENKEHVTYPWLGSSKFLSCLPLWPRRHKWTCGKKASSGPWKPMRSLCPPQVGQYIHTISKFCKKRRSSLRLLLLCNARMAYCIPLECKQVTHCMVGHAPRCPREGGCFRILGAKAIIFIIITHRSRMHQLPDILLYARMHLVLYLVHTFKVMHPTTSAVYTPEQE
jgi:hypothetical protein